MVNIVPGALWAPVDVGKRDARRKGRGLIGHVAVSNSAHLAPWLPPATRPSDWHFYLPKDPIDASHRFWQEIDLDLQSWSSYQANPDTAAFESQGGVGDDVNAPWTDNQVESASIILAYMNESEGVPLVDMVNSLAASRGFGVHRYGIDPWRVAGGQLWSSSRGKVCPGDARIAQVPVILSRAKEIRGGSPTPAPAPVPQPAPPVVHTPPTFAWNLAAGNWYGDIKGGARSHGGYYASEQAFVKIIQQWFVYLDCVPGVPSATWSTTGWCDGKWDAAYSSPACVRFHQRFYPHQPYMDRVYADDLRHLFAARP